MVSVVIPTRNRWPRVLRTLGTALRQEGVETEVMVVDDASTDRTPQRLVELHEPRLRILRLPSRQGVAGARNVGIAEALGEWVAFLDDDDIWAPRKLRAQLDCAVETGASVVYCAGVHVRAPGVVVRTEPFPSQDDLTRNLFMTNVIPASASSVLVRTDLVREVGGFDEHLEHVADWELWIRLAQAGNAVGCPEVLVGYVEHAGNMHKRAGDDVIAEFGYLLAKHRTAARDYGVGFDGVAFSRALAVGHLRAARRFRAARMYLLGALAYGNPGNLVRAVGALFGQTAMSRLRNDRPGDGDTPAWLAQAWRQPRLTPRASADIPSLPTPRRIVVRGSGAIEAARPGVQSLPRW